ncbi:MAG: PspC domain-containing protein [Propioniciclava sp.]
MTSPLVRTHDDKVIAGVCGGIGHLTKIDPNIIRVIFVLAAIFFQGWVVYLVMWLILPDNQTGRSGFTDLRNLLASGSSSS